MKIGDFFTGAMALIFGLPLSLLFMAWMFFFPAVGFLWIIGWLK